MTSIMLCGIILSEGNDITREGLKMMCCEYCIEGLISHGEKPKVTFEYATGACEMCGEVDELHIVEMEED